MCLSKIGTGLPKRAHVPTHAVENAPFPGLMGIGDSGNPRLVPAKVEQRAQNHPNVVRTGVMCCNWRRCSPWTACVPSTLFSTTGFCWALSQ